MDNFVYRVGSDSKFIGRPPRFFSGRELNNGINRFGSVYAIREDDAQAIQQAGTTTGFKGIVWSQRLWVDCDTDESSQYSKSILKEKGLDHVVYTTGNRGCHIGILRDTQPSHLLPLQDKQWVMDNLPGADLSLYWHLHLLRLPGVLHEKTGLPKLQIGAVYGSSLTLPPYIMPATTADRATIDTATVLSSRNSIFNNWRVVSHLTPTGQRRQLVVLAGRLKGEIGLTYEENLWIVMEVNRGFKVPRDSQEVERIVKHYYAT